ncbi:MAG: hypothetical protein CL949_04550 [Erythrobacter sp.]|nr:hypothetical protein [Erythrobacter sp.]
MIDDIPILPVELNHQNKAREWGYRIVPRRHIFEEPYMACFEDEAFMNEEESKIAHREEELKLMRRIQRHEGAFVLYDPRSNGECYALVGDDPEQLARHAYEVHTLVVPSLEPIEMP